MLLFFFFFLFQIFNLGCVRVAGRFCPPLHVGNEMNFMWTSRESEMLCHRCVSNLTFKISRVMYSQQMETDMLKKKTPNIYWFFINGILLDLLFFITWCTNNDVELRLLNQHWNWYFSGIFKKAQYICSSGLWNPCVLCFMSSYQKWKSFCQTKTLQ